MIDPKELRLLNWVTVSGNYGQIATNKAYACTVAFHNTNTVESVLRQDLDPIHLTEDILIKCGFEYQDNNSYQMDFNLGFTIWGRIETGMAVYVDGYQIGESIKTLHHLQNLIHSLTGKELEFKP